MVHRLLAYGLASLLIGLVGADDAVAQRLKGRVAQGRYRSPKSLFTVDVPKPRNWARAPFTIQDEISVRDGSYDGVLFMVKDFGEVRIAGVRRIPPKFDEIATIEPGIVVRELADQALRGWRQNLKERPTLLLDTSARTHYGEAALRIYEIEKGSLLAVTTGDRPPQVFDALVAVMAIRRDDSYLYAIVEDDRSEVTQDGLREMIGEFFSTITLQNASKGGAR